MKPSIRRRISVASCWASSRIAMLDSNESYEDSYAITQEFREWIICLGEDTEHLEESVLAFPQSLKDYYSEETIDADEMLEI